MRINTADVATTVNRHHNRHTRNVTDRHASRIPTRGRRRHQTPIRGKGCVIDARSPTDASQRQRAAAAIVVFCTL